VGERRASARDLAGLDDEVDVERVSFDRKSRSNYGRLKRHKALGTARPKEGTWKWYADKLESLLAKRVKMRDGYRCRQCAFDGAPTQGLLDAGHIYPKGKFPGGKYLVENIVAQCRDHNTKHISRPEYMMLWYETEHGEGSRERLHALVLAQPRRQSVEWLTAQIVECERAIAGMELLAVA
jgi:hypothetical protein